MKRTESFTEGSMVCAIVVCFSVGKETLFIMSERVGLKERAAEIRRKSHVRQCSAVSGIMVFHAVSMTSSA